MTDSQNLKQEAGKAFSSKKYAEAFELLWQLGPQEFIAYCRKEVEKSNKANWLIQAGSSDYFWKEFAVQEEVFESLFSSGFADDLLFDLLQGCGKLHVPILNRLANSYPELLLKAIRVNQVFLKPEYDPFLFDSSLPAGFHLHQECWRQIRNTDRMLWAKVEETLRAVQNQDPETVLCWIVIWIETVRFKNPGQTFQIFLGEVYGFSIELLHRQKRFKAYSVDIGIYEEGISKKFWQVFDSFLKSEANAKGVFSFLEACSTWLHFKGSFLDPYSFSPNSKLERKGLSIHLEEKPDNHYRSLLDGARYQLLVPEYHRKGVDLVDHLISSRRTVIPGAGEDYDVNYLLATFKWSTIAMLSDLGITQIQVGSEWIQTPDWVGHILAFSFNKFIRYEKQVQHSLERAPSWKAVYHNLLFQSLANRVYNNPFIGFSQREFVRLVGDQGGGASPKLAEEYLGKFGHRIKGDKKFDRFAIHYNPWLKPFLKLGKGVFCPAAFFGNNLWFFAMAQSFMGFSNRAEGKEQTQQAEESLVQNFRNSGLKAERPSETQTPGDVDILVEDGQTLLLIQMKRPYFRLNPKDQWNEHKIDQKAAQQLLKAEEANKGSGKKIEKWIVSSSFENTLQEIEGCLKVNLFELLFVLGSQSTTLVSELVTKVKNDAFLTFYLNRYLSNDLSEFEKKVISDCGLPVALSDLSKFSQDLFDVDGAMAEEFKQIYNHARQAIELNLPDRAIAWLDGCLRIEENDPDVWHLFANALFDLRDFHAGKMAFQKALSLSPENPVLRFDYALSIWELREFFQSLKELRTLKVKYPFVAEFSHLFTRMFTEAMQKGLLTSEEIQELRE